MLRRSNRRQIKRCIKPKRGRIEWLSLIDQACAPYRPQIAGQSAQHSPERIHYRQTTNRSRDRQSGETKRLRPSSILIPVAPPGATMAISFQSDEEVLRKLRDKLRKMTDEELIRFGKEVRRLAENPFQRQLEEARAEWRRRKRFPA